jgi:hypothetical protein
MAGPRDSPELVTAAERSPVTLVPSRRTAVVDLPGAMAGTSSSVIATRRESSIAPAVKPMTLHPMLAVTSTVSVIAWMARRFVTTDLLSHNR